MDGYSPMAWLDEMYTEHGAATRVVACLKKYLDDAQNGKPTDPHDLLEITDLISGYVDRVHHSKEEQHLFPLLRTLGSAENALVEQLLAEHVQGRAYVQGLKQAANPADVQANGRGYEKLLVHHIATENQAFSQADAKLTPEQRKTLDAQFLKTDRDVLTMPVILGYGVRLRMLEDKLKPHG